MEKIVREKLLRLIEDRDLNVTRVATLARVPQSSLHAMLVGVKGKKPRRLAFDVIAKVAPVLGVSLDYLADDEAHAPPIPLSEAERYAIDIIKVDRLTKEDVLNLLRRDPARIDFEVEDDLPKRSRHAGS